MSGSTITSDLSGVPDTALFGLWAAVMEELRGRNLVRSGNNPIADRAERIAADLYGVERSGGSTAGYDLITRDGTKVQVKGLRLTQPGRCTLSAFRSLDFDVVLVVVFTTDMSVKEVLRFPKAIAERHWCWSAHWNGYRLSYSSRLRNDPEVERVEIEMVTTAADASRDRPCRKPPAEMGCMARFAVDVTHTIVHRVTVKASDEAAARKRAIEAIQAEGPLADDITTPAQMRNTYDALLVK